MTTVSVQTVEETSLGVRAKLKVVPLRTGFVVQRVEWTIERDGEVERLTRAASTCVILAPLHKSLVLLGNLLYPGSPIPSPMTCIPGSGRKARL